MGDPYLPRTIAAAVLGGTNVLGGRGNLPRHCRWGHPDYPSPVDPVGRPAAVHAGAIGLKVPPETIREVVFGIVIIVMLLPYGRERLVR